MLPYESYSSKLDHVPKMYMPANIKKYMKKTKELVLHRTIQTEGAMKLVNEWTMPNMMQKVRKEKMRKRYAELER